MLISQLLEEESTEWSLFPFRVVMLQERADQPVHAHDQLEFIKLISGRVRIPIADNCYECDAGDIVFVPGGSPHALQALEPGSSMLSMTFDRSVVSALPSSADSLQLFSPLGGAQEAGCKISPGDNGWDVISGSFDLCCSEYGSKPVFYEMGIQANLYRMMSALLRCRFEAKAAESDGGDLTLLRFESLKPVFAYVESRYKEPIYLEQAARLLRMSPVYFGKVFKQRTGVTFIQYVISIRVQAAKKLLEQSRMSVTEVAEQSGFCNINYFERIFKRETGMTPCTFRKRKGTICGRDKHS